MPKADELAISLGRMIDAQAWRAGHRLPPERALCEQFSSARNTVRRALGILERDRRIVRRSGRGCFVLENTSDAGFAAIGDFIGHVATAGPADIMELRLIVEPVAAGIAAVRATLGELDEIEQAAERIARSPDIATREESDAAFHLAIFRATRNPLLVSLCEAINTVRDRAEWIENKRQILTPERKAIYDGQHAAIAAALRRRKADDASAAVRDHLDALRRDLLGQYLS
jgi:DNA-binding FadR family transcriptional regulator